MNIKSARAKLLAVILTVIMLLLYNLTGRSLKTTVQSDFESWLANIDEQLRKKEVSAEQVPLIVVDIRSGSERPINWQIGMSDRLEVRERVLRILHLIDEGNALALSPSRFASSSAALISISIKDDKTEFKAQFNSTDIDSNTKLQLMLRLLKEYSAEVPANSQFNALSGMNNDRS